MNSPRAREQITSNSTVFTIASMAVVLSLSGCASAFEAGMSASEPNQAPNEGVINEVGQTATSDSGIMITLTDAYPFPESEFSAAEKDILLGVDVEISNGSEYDIVVSSLLSFGLQGTNGNTYSQSIFAEVDSRLDATVKSGRNLVGTIVFDADEDTDYFFAYKPDLMEEAIEFQITTSDWSD